MRITITIDCDNAAFNDAPSIEIAAILTKLAAKLVQDEILRDYRPLFDNNRNRVGEFSVEE